MRQRSKPAFPILLLQPFAGQACLSVDFESETFSRLCVVLLIVVRIEDQYWYTLAGSISLR